VRRRRVILRLARAEMAEASAWYNTQRVGLGDEFLDECQRSMDGIVESPARWPLYQRNVRRYLMRRFPYLMYYDERPGRVRILRVVHSSRDPVPIRELLP
jgi:hypothetical protein